MKPEQFLQALDLRLAPLVEALNRVAVSLAANTANAAPSANVSMPRNGRAFGTMEAGGQPCRKYSEVTAIAPGLSHWILAAIKRASRGQPDSPFVGRLTTVNRIIRWLDAHPEFVANRTMQPIEVLARVNHSTRSRR